MAGDDKKSDPKVSELARFGIATAVDHLGSVVYAMVDASAVDTDRPIRHYAHLTTLRTVLLASARTQWLLEPSTRPPRLIRAMMIELENLVQQRKAIAALTGDHMSADLVAGRDEAVAFLLGEIQNLKERALVLRPDKALCEPPDTASLLRDLVDEHTDEGLAIRHLWRTGSAAAHALHWAAIKPGEFDEEGFDLSLQGSMLLLNDAIKLYTKRATSYL